MTMLIDRRFTLIVIFVGHVYQATAYCEVCPKYPSVSCIELSCYYKENHHHLCLPHCSQYLGTHRMSESGELLLQIASPFNSFLCTWAKASTAYCLDDCCQIALHYQLFPTTTPNIPISTPVTSPATMTTQSPVKQTISPTTATIQTMTSSTQGFMTNSLNKLTTKWTGPCIDTRKDCSNYHEYCFVFEDWEKHHCPVTCGYCQASNNNLTSLMTTAKYVTTTEKPTTTMTTKRISKTTARTTPQGKTATEAKISANWVTIQSKGSSKWITIPQGKSNIRYV